MDLKHLIIHEAARIDQVMREDIDRLADDLDPLLIEILNYGLFSGGKRIRPLLTILSARFFGDSNTDVYHLASALEYLHTATLFHDDVIDSGDERRGEATVYKRFGLSEAVLAGDFLHAHSMAMVGHYGGEAALSVFCQATRGMVDGEFSQLRNARNLNQSEADYFSVVMGKTALLIGAACELGALFAGADEHGRAGLRTYGINLGCAFQIVDDLLDYLGDTRKTGKAVGNDLMEAKMTLPLIYALQRADGADRSRLLEILSDDRARQECFQQVSGLIDKYHGFEDAGEKAKQVIGEAIAALPESAGDHSVQRSFLALSDYVLNREK